MSFWPFNNNPKVDIIVTRSPKTGKWFNRIVDSETRKAIGVSAARHLEDEKYAAISEAHQMRRVRKIIVEES